MTNGQRAVRRLLCEAAANLKAVEEITTKTTQYGGPVKLDRRATHLLGAIKVDAKYLLGEEIAEPD